MTLLALRNVGHAYFGRTVLDAIDLDVAEGEIVALVGPSGCGKSTLIHIAAGLIDPLRGKVSVHYTHHAMVFQEPRLLPWTTARGNIEYPLQLAGADRVHRREAVEHAADAVSLLPEDLDKFPSELSGGMRQRTAIARALVTEPAFIYFDEPFTALDVALKRRMQDLVINAAQRSRFAGLFVSHDLAEAVRLAHRIAVLDSHGNGIVGIREVPKVDHAKVRDDADIHAIVHTFLNDDPIFRQIHDVDERQRL